MVKAVKTRNKVSNRHASRGHGDGRRRRSASTHDKILATMADLIGRRDRPATVAEVARAAGVATRTIFVHFPDFETMWRETMETLRPRFDSMMVEIPPTGPLSKRLEQFVATRSALFEKQASFRQAGNLMLPHSLSMRRRRAQHRRLYRRRLTETFAPEMAAIPAARRAAWLEALAAVADWDFWESLRRGQRLSAAAARAAWKEALRAVLGAAGANEGVDE